MLHEADVAVAGGGPAGCVAAIRLAEAGHRVVLISRPRRGYALEGFSERVLDGLRFVGCDGALRAVGPRVGRVATFGAHPRPLPGGSPPGDGRPPGGASFAAAHLTGFLARNSASAATSAADRRRHALEHLERSASHRGPERRTAKAFLRGE